LIDPEDEISETNETNNVWRSTSLVNIPANPVPPVNVQATDGLFSQKIVITWESQVTEPLYFAVFRSTLNSTLFAQRISPELWIPGTSFDDVTALNGVTYYYFIKASRFSTGLHESEFSSGDAGYKKIAPPFPVLASDGQFSDKIEIKWPASSGASYYRVYRNTSPIVAENMFISGNTWINDTSFTDLTATFGNTYYYWVRAANSQFGSYASDYSIANTGWLGFITAPVAVASDGTSTSNISVSWNTVSGASYYQVFRNTMNDPETAVSISSWQTATSFTDNAVSAGMLYYYWIKASQDAAGTVTTGLGTGDSGFRNLLAPTGVLASDGSSTEYVNIKWVSSASATYYRVYRNTLGFPCNCPVSNWQADRNFNDYSAVPGVLYYYWIKASSDSNVIISAYSSENSGYRKIATPLVTASTGIYTNKVTLSWTNVAGASYYKVSRSTVEEPSVLTVLANWSNTLNGSFEDLTATPGQAYNYYVAGATNSSGLRAGSSGQDIGYAGACGNMIDDPGFRVVNLHGSTLDISQRIVNEGPFNLTNPGQIALALENANPDGTPEAMLGYVNIPALAVGSYYDYNFSVDLSTIPGFTLNLGEYHLAVYMSWDNSNCDSDPDDDYLIWDTPSFEYTDAMYGTYSIGEGTGDFNDISKAVEALQTRGISDDVVFNIKPGQYLEQLTFTSIEGSSPSKTITFQSESSSQKATIIAQPGPTNNFTLRFSQASNYVFRNLILRTTGFSDFESTYGKVIVIGDDCHNLEFSDNQIIGFSDPSHLNDDNDVIYANYVQASGILIDGNQITNGVHGIYLTGSSGASIQNCVIMRNTITGFNEAGIWLNYHNHPVILNNTISNTNVINFYVTGMNLSNISNGFDVSNNNIQLQSVDQNLFGMTIDNLNMDGSQPGILSNNMMAMVSGSSFLYGIQFYQIHKTRILNNSIHLKADYSEFSSGLMFSCSDVSFGFDNSLVNNIIDNQAGGYCITYHENPVNYHMLSESDYNDFLSSGPDLFLYRMIPMQGIDDWNAETGFDSNSISADPGFVSDLDLHATSEAVNDAGIIRTEVSFDIDGETRSAIRPDIGADEFTPPSQFKTLNLIVFLEGLMTGTNVMRQAQDITGPRYNPGIADEITVELRQSSNYNNIIYSATAFLSTNGQAVVNIPSYLNNIYYLTVRHRNSIETTSIIPVSFLNPVISYNFSSGAAQAYGSNQKVMFGTYVLYGGDVNQDGIVDGSDMAAIDNASTAVLHGYVPEDANGDAIVDGSDMAMIDNNSTATVMVHHP
jgi:parallel beta-helix repeat protein